MLIWSIDKTIATSEKVLYTVFTGGYMFLLYQDAMLGEAQWKMIASSTVIFNIASRVP
jgi:hypothetical protein